MGWRRRPSGPSCASVNTQREGQQLLQAHSVWLGLACSFITAAVEQLRALLAMETTSPGTADGISHLWLLVVMQCTFLKYSLADWPMPHMQANTHLFAALGAVTDLMLDVQQSDPDGRMHAKLMGG